VSDPLTEDVESIPQAEATPHLWRVIGAAVQGVSHERLGLPCQDAQGYLRLPGGELLIALADGAGSAARSDEGARLAVQIAIESLAGGLAGQTPEDELDFIGLLLSAYDEARQALLDLAEEAGELPRLFATTLSLVVILEGKLAVGQLGDGVVVCREPGGELFVASPQQRGEYANETYFLTQEDALEQVDIQVFENEVEALAVMSDGLARLALRLPSQEPHSPFFSPLFAFLTSVEAEAEGEEKLAAFLASERIRARTDDDKALVLAVRE
jgi:hypothetical protein